MVINISLGFSMSIRLKVICKFKHYAWGLTSRKSEIVPL